ncbi:histidine phosphatase family protein [Bradyrhizobium erythrophlei]|uniref:histidine phosphatase family protein n=1 Tax=Bradyrhizobium erythrophlei TaxID=1437360 RepID=UPI0035EF921D
MKFALGWRSVLAVALAAIFIHLPFQPFVQPASADELPVIILVRHADKAAQPADDPPLTEAGAKRAQDLAAALRTAGVASIITTQLRRTRETAQPLAKALGIAPEVINVGQRALVANPTADALFPPEVIKERAEYIKTLELAVRHRSGVVLVVGHDWSVPGLIASLGGPQLPNICSSVYDNLFVLTSARGNVNLVRARYGAPTPEVDCK